jgi:hypothetical protein
MIHKQNAPFNGKKIFKKPEPLELKYTITA